MPVNIGFNNFVISSRILSLHSISSAPVKKIIQQSRDDGNLINATCGKSAKSLIILDNGVMVLSAIQPETIASRINHALAKKVCEEKKSLTGGKKDE